LLLLGFGVTQIQGGELAGFCFLLRWDAYFDNNKIMGLTLSGVKGGFAKMITKNKYIPEIRFEGFDKPWNHQELGTICDTFADGDWIEAKDQSTTGIRLLQTGNIGVCEYLNKPDKSKWISPSTFARLNCTEVFPGDILISRLPEPAGRACIVPYTGQRMITAVDCTIVRTSEGYASKHLIQILSSEAYFKIVNDFLAGGTRQRISKSNLSKIMVPLPQEAEQIKIGDFFHVLDGAIALKKQQYDKTAALKKTMLEKMFPKKNTDVPEIRFEGFTGPWETRILGEYSTLITKGTTPKDKSGSGEINFVKVENIKDGKITPIARISAEEHENYLSRSKLEENDILFSIAGTLGRTALVSKNMLPANTNQALAIIRGYDFDIRFLLTSLEGNAVTDYLQRNPVIGAQPNLSLAQVGSLVITAPCKAEQTAIGSFFKNINNLQETQNQEIKKLQTIKKACLNKMLI